VLSIPVDYPYNCKSDVWVDAGGISFGPVNVDAAMALPGPEFHSLQDKFLKQHDEKTHRLWFLWPKEELPRQVQVHGKCGCVGGCAFFGSNRNGPYVFHPSDNDFKDSVNAAVFHLCPEDVAFGFGQSLLQKDQLIFSANSGMATFLMFSGQSRVHRHLYESMTDQQQADLSSDAHVSSTSANISSTRMDPEKNSKDHIDENEEIAQTEYSFMSGSTLVANGDLDQLNRQTTSSSSSVRRTSVENGSPALVSSDKTDEVPSDYIPDGSIPDAYDTDRYVSTPSDVASWPSVASGSSGSLPDVTASQKDKGHERKLSDPPPRLQQQQQQQQQQASLQRPNLQRHPFAEASVCDANVISVNNSSESRRSSKNSIPSMEGNSGSRHSSLTSPVLRRLSSQLSFQREGSILSIAGSGSEHFFSAGEDVTSSMQTLHLSSPFGTLRYPTGSKPSQAMPSAGGIPIPHHTHSFSPENVSISSSYYGDVDSPHSSMYVHEEQTETEKSSLSSQSTSSFVSAVSSQGTSNQSISQIPSSSSSPTINADDPEANIPDEFDHELDGDDLPMASNYVNLHGQINQPITKSFLLTRCYIKHMTQLECSYWSAPPPLPDHMLLCKGKENIAAQSDTKQTATPSSTVTGQMEAPAWIPHFCYVNQGFTPELMANKKELKSPPSLVTHTNSSDHCGQNRQFFPSEDHSDDEGKYRHSVCCN